MHHPSFYSVGTYRQYSERATCETRAQRHLLLLALLYQGWPSLVPAIIYSPASNACNAGRSVPAYAYGYRTFGAVLQVRWAALNRHASTHGTVLAYIDRYSELSVEAY